MIRGLDETGKYLVEFHTHYIYIDGRGNPSPTNPPIPNGDNLNEYEQKLVGTWIYSDYTGTVQVILKKDRIGTLKIYGTEIIYNWSATNSKFTVSNSSNIHLQENGDYKYSLSDSTLTVLGLQFTKQ